MLRQHWPGDRGALFTLLMLSTYMDGKGAMAWPTIETLASDTGQAERTIRRHIDRALELEFLASWKTGDSKRGRAWRRTYYQAHIPDKIKLSEDDEALANTVGSIDFDAAQVVREPTKEQPYSNANRRALVEAPLKGARTGQYPLEHRSSETEGPDTADGRTGHQEQHGADITDVDTSNTLRSGQARSRDTRNLRENEGQQHTEGADTFAVRGPDTQLMKSSSEVFISSSQGSIPREATADAGAARAFGKNSSRQQTPDQELERERKALKLLREDPGTTVEQLLHCYGLTPERAVDLRNQVELERTGRHA